MKMSERASFVTEYVYCQKCFHSLKWSLVGHEKYFCSIPIPSWEINGIELPIIAGKVGGLGPGDAFITLLSILEEIETCHEVRIAFLGDTDNSCKFLIIKPNKEGIEEK